MCDNDQYMTNDRFEPLNDIIDYLVRRAKINFKTSRVDGDKVRTTDNIKAALDIYHQSPTDFLLQYGKYLSPQHLTYFEITRPDTDIANYKNCIDNLKIYHSEASSHKRVKNRRFKALQKLKKESDYFSDKQMMYRNPLLYEQLVGQYLTDDEISERDRANNENITLLTMILDTVDHNQMRETKDYQLHEEEEDDKSSNSKGQDIPTGVVKRWGEFDDDQQTIKTDFSKTEIRKQAMISAPERDLLRQEFCQEMYSSFLNGIDADVDYDTIDNNEELDDLKQLSQDEEDRYFDSEQNEIKNLEEHMSLVAEYSKTKSNDNFREDTLDMYMRHLNKKDS